MNHRRRVLAWVVFFASIVPGISSDAARPYHALSIERLSRANTGKLTVDLPLIDGEPAAIELEPFEVWRDNAAIVVYGANGSQRSIPVPSTRLYKGRVAGVVDSAVFLAVEPSGDLRGMIAMRDRLFQIGRGVPRQRLEKGERRQSVEPVLVREFDTTDDTLRGARKFFCATDDLPIEGFAEAFDRDNPTLPKNDLNGSSTATYGLNLAIETDTELYDALGSTSAVTTYITSLVGQASVIYQRDLRTTLTIGTLHIWSGGTDPWTVSPPADLSGALGEVGTYWHTNYAAVPRSTVVMVSGKAFDGGIAWKDVLCSGDFPCADGDCGDSSLDGQYGGAYAFIGAQPGTFPAAVPDPTLTLNGTMYALPDTSDYWMLLAFAHELGHNAGGPHTHCVELTEADKTAYGVARNYIDECYSGECFAGAPNAPPELGTIMSFCQNIVVSGWRQSRYTFWQPDEPSELIAPYFTETLESATPNAAITIGSGLPCAPSQTASAPNVAGNTYSWTMTGGTISSGASTHSIAFTPTASPITVQVTISNALGCSITNSSTTTTLCIIPTNVVAQAVSSTSVSVSWTAVSGAASYDVARCTSLVSCTIVGTAVTASFLDTTASPNTAYLYRVRSRDGEGNPSSYSADDLATTLIFTDPALDLVTIKAVHMTQLRTAVNAVRVLAGLSAYSFTDPTLSSSVFVKRLHVTELRDALADARSTLGLASVSYTNPTITAGVSVIKAVDVTELRAGTQ